MRPAAPITAILISVITAPGAGMARARAAPSTRSAEREGYSNARGTAEVLERSGIRRSAICRDGPKTGIRLRYPPSTVGMTRRRSRGRLARLRPIDGLEDEALRLLGAAPLLDLDPLARLQVLVV